MQHAQDEEHATTIWGEAVNTTVFILNRSLMKSLKGMSFEV
jgi:hypothetical protein